MLVSWRRCGKRAEQPHPLLGLLEPELLRVQDRRAQWTEAVAPPCVACPLGLVLDALEFDSLDGMSIFPKLFLYSEKSFLIFLSMLGVTCFPKII